MNPIGIVINRPKGDPTRLRHKGKPTIMEDGSVCVTCKDELHRKFWVSVTPELVAMLVQALRDGKVAVNRLEFTDAGVIDWKQEAERANRLLADRERSSAATSHVPIRREWLEHVVKTLQGDLPSGRIGDVVFLLRDQLRDALDHPTDEPQAPIKRVEGATDIVDEAACLIWAELCPGLVMRDEDRPYYEAAAKAILALSRPHDKT